MHIYMETFNEWKTLKSYKNVKKKKKKLSSQMSCQIVYVIRWVQKGFDKLGMIITPIKTRNIYYRT